MTDIVSVGHGSIGPIDRNARLNGRTESPSHSDHDRTTSIRRDVSDRVELSDHARHLSTLRSLPAVREDRVAEIRDAIANGTYDTEGKLDTAVDRLLEDLLAS